MNGKRRRDKSTEWARNILLILAAAAVVYVFFNLDIVRKGESVFSNTAAKKLKFAGALGQRDYTDREIARILKYIGARNTLFREVKINASPQDSYREVTPSTDIVYELHVALADGFTFSTPARRAARRDLVAGLLNKLDKDLRAYQKMKKEGRNPSSMINTM
ncbi:hypothetical protein LF599_00755 [Pseudodesulfovibrio thermohalotolerans]|uniref:hypothetical protein n=1 Tax=Pseudodesulfovibrio thermohalotolerans TaxID=2880651 RepID=UPI002440F01D|nr:hypothetical protein [Pseudodesulfovibrio thermohalotolerans]WFS62719.1 hypothetical protein LF599_00755 [Pseudodesulfovibrio thermohalotolerans]